MTDDDMVEVTRSLGKYYKNYAIYMKSPSGKGYVLYKPKGVPIEAVRIKEKRHPKHLYISLQDKVREIASFQRKYNHELKKTIRDDPVRAKNLLQKTMDLSLSEPRTDVLRNMQETIDIIVKEYLETPTVVGNLLDVSAKDYSTSVHSINVMLFCLGFGYYNDYALEAISRIGLMGLMHDVGKIQVPEEILKADRELTVRETKLLNQHTEHGYRILTDCDFDPAIARVALEHHEQIDGTGHPEKKIGRDLLESSKIIAIIDKFEKLTCLRPGYTPLKPIEALAAIMEIVENGKMDRDMFKQFAHSVVGMQGNIRPGA